MFDTNAADQNRANWRWRSGASERGSGTAPPYGGRAKLTAMGSEDEVVGSVGALWRYPVKSMVGEQRNALDVRATGVVGDRGWAIRNEEKGAIQGAKKLGALMRCSAVYDGEPAPGTVPPATVRLPDGTTAVTGTADLDEALSALLEVPVTAVPLAPPDDLDHYRRGAPDSDDLIEELNGIFGREPGEPLPDLSVFPPEILEFESPPGTHVDAFPLMLLTESSLAGLARLVPDAVVDIRRFRPNVVIRDAVDGFPEQSWVGRRLALGEAELEITTGCPRCVMVTREIDSDVPADRTVLRAIVRELDQQFGVYATVVRPGPVRVGDPVRLI